MPSESVGFGRVAAHPIWPAACCYIFLKVLRNYHDTASVSSFRGSTYAPFCYFRSRPDRHCGNRFPSRASWNCSQFRERLLRLPPLAGGIDAEIHGEQVYGYRCARCLHPASCSHRNDCPVNNYPDRLSRWIPCLKCETLRLRSGQDIGHPRLRLGHPHPPDEDSLSLPIRVQINPV
jgi:hypothetical protein